MTMATWSFLGWVCLSLSLSRHQLDALGRALTPGQEQLLRIAGTALLALSLWPALWHPDIGVALTEWVAALSVSALSATVVLTWRPRWFRHVAAAAAVLALALAIAP